MNAKAAIWRPVDAGYGSLLEVRFKWDIETLFDAHEYLDAKAEAEVEAAEKLRRQGG